MHCPGSTNSLNVSGSMRPHPDAESITELQRILTDERNRAAQHKLNYQQIKCELTKLQERHSQTEEELSCVLEERRVESEEASRKLAQMNRRLLDAQGEIESLKANQITDKRIEMVRLKIEQEFEGVYNERYARCASEAERMRLDLGRLRNENIFLKSEYEHLHKENSRVAEETRLIHETEITALKAEKARLLASSIEMPQEIGSVKELSKENGVLRNQLKTVSNELKEVQIRLDHEKLNNDQELRAKTKHVTEITSGCRKMEIEIDSLKKQLIDGQKELSSLNSQYSALNLKNSELERKNRMLQNRLDELVQKAKVDLTQLKLESTKQKGDIERQKELLEAKIDELEYQLHLAGTKCGQLESQLHERELGIAKREAAIKEKEWSKVQQLENEKLELESQVTNLQSALREERVSVSGKMLNLEEKTLNAEQKRLETEKDLEVMKNKMDSMNTEFKNMKSGQVEMKSKLLQQEAELDECYNRLASAELSKKERAELEEHVKELENNLRETKAHHETILNDKEHHWRHDRDRLHERIKELEEELAKSLEKTRVTQDELRRKNKKHASFFNTQKKRLQVVTAKLEESQAENEILRRNVPAEDHQKLRRELKELRRKHQEYRAIIMQSGFGGNSQQPPFTRYDCHGESGGQDLRFEQNLQNLKKRLEVLDEIQQKQVPEVFDLQEHEKVDVEKDSSSYGLMEDKNSIRLST